MEQLCVKHAEELLEWASSQNPGPWVDHSKVVAGAAAKIAEKCDLDTETAYGLGLLHDIGRHKGPTAMMHILDGYDLLEAQGYPFAAQICVTHSFPTQTFQEYSGANDCTPENQTRIMTILEAAQYSEYDRLIQLCDSLALPEGVCLMEKRLVDVAMRHGTNQWMLAKWKALFSIFESFQLRMDVPFYSLFPEIVENTFHSGPFFHPLA